MESCPNPGQLEKVSWRLLGKVTSMPLRVPQLSTSFFCEKTRGWWDLGSLYGKWRFILHCFPCTIHLKNTPRPRDWQLPTAPAAWVCWYWEHQLLTLLRPSDKVRFPPPPLAACPLIHSGSFLRGTQPGRGTEFSALASACEWQCGRPQLVLEKCEVGGYLFGVVLGHWEDLPTPVQNNPSLPQWLRHLLQCLQFHSQRCISFH